MIDFLMKIDPKHVRIVAIFLATLYTLSNLFTICFTFFFILFGAAIKNPLSFNMVVPVFQIVLLIFLFLASYKNPIIGGILYVIVNVVYLREFFPPSIIFLGVAIGVLFILFWWLQREQQARGIDKFV